MSHKQSKTVLNKGRASEPLMEYVSGKVSTNRLFRIDAGYPVQQNPALIRSEYSSLGHKGQGLPVKILKELEISQAILNYGDDWDGLGAVPVNKTAYDVMHRIVKEYGMRFSLASLSLLEMEINAVPDGSIDVAWYMPEARLLMNFRMVEDGEVLLYYYGARIGERDAIKGRVETERAVEFLVTWMNTILC
ncbi:MAG: hypothetical protein R2787_08545 [Saprospiraceae bacterium]